MTGVGRGFASEGEESPLDYLCGAAREPSPREVTPAAT
jgi:hypothetical protein